MGAFAQDQAAGKHVVERALAGCQADTETVDDEIIAAQNGDVHLRGAAGEHLKGLCAAYPFVFLRCTPQAHIPEIRDS